MLPWRPECMVDGANDEIFCEAPTLGGNGNSKHERQDWVFSPHCWVNSIVYGLM